ncbi:MAG TPA: ribonuclease Y [Pseudobdellovibrionaceae bacterium]|nr:ribonuclease Y [Pseudobdellovibrionaceae bacterium]
MVIEILVGIVSFAIGGVIIYFIKKYKDEAQKKSAHIESEKILNKARAEAQKIKKDSENRAKDFESRARRNVETEIQKQKNQLRTKEQQLEKKLKDQDDQHKSKIEEGTRYLSSLKTREEKIAISEQRTQELIQRTEEQVQELKVKLESVAGLRQEEAKRLLFESLEDEAKQAAAKRIAQIEEETRKEADRSARRIISMSLSRFASEYTSERTVGVMALPSDEMKGKIIGREGRNIRTLEALCGVDLIVDDTPEAVVISGFDPVRRELARRSIEKLIEDGRVHPARIEEVVDKQKIELAKSIREEGEKSIVELGIGNVHTEIVKLIGSMKYRSSLAQNLLNHSMEVAYIAGLLASELGVNVKLARRAGLLHDIGKAVEHSAEGSHAVVGAEWAKKYGENEQICHAIRAHHEDEKPNSTLAWIVIAANVLSNSRPGARRPHMDAYIHRLEDLESIGNSFDGVLRTFALQAGKEVRVLVESSKVTDDQTLMLSRDIARKIERELPQAGSLKVTIVRETRSVEMAR